MSFAGYQNPLWIADIYANYGLVPNQLIYEGAIWQIITSMFIHSQGFIFHILFNMIALWSLGNFIEKKIGSQTFFWLYFISGITSGIFIVGVPWVFNWVEMMNRSTIGASGAILGLLGALYVLAPNSRLLVFFFPMKVKTAVFLIGGISLILIFFDQNSIISHLGHLGGIIGGIFYTRIIVQRYMELTQRTRQGSIVGPENESVKPIPLGDERNLLEISSESRNSDNGDSTMGNDQKSRIFPEDQADSQNIEEDVKKVLVYDEKTGKFYYK